MKVLTRLKITEVSAVDRGAGEQCRIVLAKRDDSDYSNTEPSVEERARAKMEGRAALRDAEDIERRKREGGDEDRNRYFDLLTGRTTTAELYGVDKSAAGDEEEGLIAATDGVPKKHRSITFDTIAGERMRFPSERALAEWLAIQSRIRKSTSEDPNPMSFEDKIRDIAKREGVVVIAKIMVADNRSYGISESELVDLISNHERRDGESPAQCFTRQYEAYNDDGAALRKAIAIAKNMPFEDDSEARAEADSRAAMDELVAIGKQRWPGLSRSQQFARAYECNVALAKRATRRPGPSTSFPFPTEKAMSLEPRVTSGGMDSFLDVDADSPRAYQELMKLVEQQRREGESEAAAFERVFLDPANKTLALRALGQRAPTESSPPRQRQY